VQFAIQIPWFILFWIFSTSPFNHFLWNSRWEKGGWSADCWFMLTGRNYSHGRPPKLKKCNFLHFVKLFSRNHSGLLCPHLPF
jgi:hypothetical protein